MCLILLENLMDSYKKILIDSFEDFLVDQARQFQNIPNFRIDSFRFFWTYIHPLVRLEIVKKQDVHWILLLTTRPDSVFIGFYCSNHCHWASVTKAAR